MNSRNYPYPSPVVAEHIQEIWDEYHLRDVDVATILGMERKSIGAYRRGDTNPNIKFIRYICETYHKDANWLLDLN